MANQTYRVGIIGCGGMGRSHSRAWTAHPRAEVVAAMDIFEEAAQRVSDEYDVPAIYTDVDEMLAKEDLDIVSITTWQGPAGGSHRRGGESRRERHYRRETDGSLTRTSRRYDCCL